MNTIENNKLIAEFMGGKPKDGKYWFIPYHCLVNMDTIEIGNGRISKYHTSWDWLMPVVEKIWNIIGNRSSLFYFEVDEEFTIYGKEKPSMDSNKSNCYLAVVEFIKWYNENKED